MLESWPSLACMKWKKPEDAHLSGTFSNNFKCAEFVYTPPMLKIWSVYILPMNKTWNVIDEILERLFLSNPYCLYQANNFFLEFLLWTTHKVDTFLLIKFFWIGFQNFFFDKIIWMTALPFLKIYILWRQIMTLN